MVNIIRNMRTHAAGIVSFVFSMGCLYSFYVAMMSWGASINTEEALASAYSMSLFFHIMLFCVCAFGIYQILTLKRAVIRTSQLLISLFLLRVALHLILFGFMDLDSLVLNLLLIFLLIWAYLKCQSLRRHGNLD